MLKFFKKYEKTIFWAMLVPACLALGVTYTMTAVLTAQKAKPAGKIFEEEIYQNEFVHTKSRLEQYARVLSLAGQGIDVQDGHVWEHLLYLREAKKLGLMVEKEEISKRIQKIYKDIAIAEKLYQKQVELSRTFQDRVKLFQEQNPTFPQKVARQIVGYQIEEEFRRYKEKVKKEVQWDPKDYLRLVTQKAKVSLPLFEEVLEEKMIIEKYKHTIEKFASLPPEKVYQEYQKRYHRRQATYLIFSADDYQIRPENITPQQLEKHYKKDPERFRIPEKYTIEFVSLQLKDYEKNFTITDKEVSEFVQHHPEEYGHGEISPEDKLDIKIRLQQQKAKRFAYYELQKFIQKWQNLPPHTSQNLQELAQKENLTYFQIHNLSLPKLLKNKKVKQLLYQPNPNSNSPLTQRLPHDPISVVSPILPSPNGMFAYRILQRTPSYLPPFRREDKKLMATILEDYLKVPEKKLKSFFNQRKEKYKRPKRIAFEYAYLPYKDVYRQLIQTKAIPPYLPFSFLVAYLRGKKSPSYLKEKDFPAFVQSYVKIHQTALQAIQKGCIPPPSSSPKQQKKSSSPKNPSPPKNTPQKTPKKKNSPPNQNSSPLLQLTWKELEKAAKTLQKETEKRLNLVKNLLKEHLETSPTSNSADPTKESYLKKLAKQYHLESHWQLLSLYKFRHHPVLRSHQQAEKFDTWKKGQITPIAEADTRLGKYFLHILEIKPQDFPPFPSEDAEEKEAQNLRKQIIQDYLVHQAMEKAKSTAQEALDDANKGRPFSEIAKKYNATHIITPLLIKEDITNKSHIYFHQVIRALFEDLNYPGDILQKPIESVTTRKIYLVKYLQYADAPPSEFHKYRENIRKELLSKAKKEYLQHWLIDLKIRAFPEISEHQIRTYYGLTSQYNRPEEKNSVQILEVFKVLPGGTELYNRILRPQMRLKARKIVWSYQDELNHKANEKAKTLAQSLWKSYQTFSQNLQHLQAFAPTPLLQPLLETTLRKQYIQQLAKQYGEDELKEKSGDLGWKSAANLRYFEDIKNWPPLTLSPPRKPSPEPQSPYYLLFKEEERQRFAQVHAKKWEISFQKLIKEKAYQNAKQKADKLYHSIQKEPTPLKKYQTFARYIQTHHIQEREIENLRNSPPDYQKEVRKIAQIEQRKKIPYIGRFQTSRGFHLVRVANYRSNTLSIQARRIYLDLKNARKQAADEKAREKINSIQEEWEKELEKLKKNLIQKELEKFKKKLENKKENNQQKLLQQKQKKLEKQWQEQPRKYLPQKIEIFQKLVQKYSEDETTKKFNGDMGWFDKNKNKKFLGTLAHYSRFKAELSQPMSTTLSSKLREELQKIGVFLSPKAHKSMFSSSTKKWEIEDPLASQSFLIQEEEKNGKPTLQVYATIEYANPSYFQGLQPGEITRHTTTNGEYLLLLHERQPGQTQYHISQIAVENFQKAQQVYQQLLKTKEEIYQNSTNLQQAWEKFQNAFAKLAKQYSIHTPTKSKGGNLGWINPNTSPLPQIQTVASSIQTKSLIPPYDVEIPENTNATNSSQKQPNKKQKSPKPKSQPKSPKKTPPKKIFYILLVAEKKEIPEKIHASHLFISNHTSKRLPNQEAKKIEKELQQRLKQIRKEILTPKTFTQLNSNLKTQLNTQKLSPKLLDQLQSKGIYLSTKSKLQIVKKGKVWKILDPTSETTYTLELNTDKKKILVKKPQIKTSFLEKVTLTEDQQEARQQGWLFGKKQNPITKQELSAQDVNPVKNTLGKILFALPPQSLSPVLKVKGGYALYFVESKNEREFVRLYEAFFPTSIEANLSPKQRNNIISQTKTQALQLWKQLHNSKNPLQQWKKLQPSYPQFKLSEISIRDSETNENLQAALSPKNFSKLLKPIQTTTSFVLLYPYKKGRKIKEFKVRRIAILCTVEKRLSKKDVENIKKAKKQTIQKKIQQIQNGQLLFADLARQESTDTTTASKGGFLQISLPSPELPYPITQHLRTLSEGEISPLIHFQQAFHLYLILEKEADSYQKARYEMAQEVLRRYHKSPEPKSQ